MNSNPLRPISLLMGGLLLALAGSCWTSFAGAQDDLLLNSTLGLPQEEVEDPVQLSADFKLKAGTRRGLLRVKAEVIEGWHVFSVTQKPGGPVASSITVAESPQYTVQSKFQPDSKPHVKVEPAFENLEVEEHEGTVVWSAVLEINEGVAPEDLEITVVYNGQTCENKEGGTCKPIFDQQLTAKFGGFDETLKLPAARKKLELKPFTPDQLHASVVGQVVKLTDDGAPISPGDTVQLELTVTSLEDYHVYAYSTLQEGHPLPYVPTLISFTGTNQWKIVGPKVSAQPEVDDVSFGPDQPVLYHHDPVTWAFEVTLPKDLANNQPYALTGGMQLQTCNALGCDQPVDLSFSVTIPVGTEFAAPLTFDTASFGSVQEAVKAGKFATPVAKAASPQMEATDGGGQPPAPDSPRTENPPALTVQEDSPELIAEMARLYNPDEKISYLTYADMDANPIGSGGTSSASQTTFLTALFGAFVGGMLLNLMPCVFPVLGIKVMGFVKQGGEHPAKIRMHGLAFALGLLVSMWALAGTILVVKTVLGESVQWGAQMANPYFVGFIVVLLFVMGLNLAGVFEFGTSLTSLGGSVGSKSGYGSSFFSGVLTTLIATPCSGPFLGTAMSYTLAQPPLFSMFMFTIFGLGIASPYVILAFFPTLIQRLPKPGPWMDTFKVTMAFALFATVAFFLRTFGIQTGVDGLSWLLMALVVLGLAAFFYGTWSEPHIKAGKRWVWGYTVPALVAGAGIWMTYDAASQQVVAAEKQVQSGELQWARWSPGKVEYSLNRNRRIIWVDYTAEW